jgi:diguanylate cyclase (GGDEF)-like protein
MPPPLNPLKFSSNPGRMSAESFKGPETPEQELARRRNEAEHADTLAEVLAEKAEDAEYENYLLRLHNEQLQKEGGIDPLTGLEKHEVFKAALEVSLRKFHKVEHEQRKGGEARQGVSVVFIDLDGFKDVNDRYGHKKGDEVLVRTAEILSRGLHRETDLLSRRSGDEFLVLLSNVSEEQALGAVNNLQKLIDGDSEFKDLGVTASFGVCSSDITNNPAELEKFAEIAAYKAKEAGKNQVIKYEENMKMKGE